MGRSMRRKRRRTGDGRMGEPLQPSLVRRPDGTMVFPDGSTLAPGETPTATQQRQLDVTEAWRKFGATGDTTDLVRLGIWGTS